MLFYLMNFSLLDKHTLRCDLRFQLRFVHCSSHEWFEFLATFEDSKMDLDVFKRRWNKRKIIESNHKSFLRLILRTFSLIQVIVPIFVSTSCGKRRFMRHHLQRHRAIDGRIALEWIPKHLTSFHHTRHDHRFLDFILHHANLLELVVFVQVIVRIRVQARHFQ